MIIRELKEEDVSFIYSSYLKSLRPHKSNISNDVYYKGEHCRLQRLLLNSLTVVLVDPADENHILGYAIAEIVPDQQLILHYVYIKKKHRSTGLAKLLVDTILSNVDKSLPLFCSNYNRDFLPILNRYNFTFNPYLHDSQLGEQ